MRPTQTSAEALDAYSGLLSTVFGDGPKFAAQALAWRYRDNPAGSVVGADAWSGETLAAHYVACPLRASVEGQALKGLLSLNTATHPDFQGQGLFTRLARTAYDQGAELGYDFVIGVANAQSTPGFLGRLGFQQVGRLEAGLLLRTPRRFAPAELQFSGTWDEATLAWRLANPAAAYRTVRRGDLTAVYADTHLPGVRCAGFVETDAGEAPRPAPLGLTLFMGLDPRIKLGQLGYWPLPDRFRPSPLNLIYRPLSARAPRSLDPRATAISFLDFDPY
ncbi:GNAT family N-acetyltransferase [Phenylobacterium sp.]|uniref:GNAT family N-acetyltransferase n=1 Tax=Phenylobacterium sp. TaxID=1871053 RepID=UPI002731F664|nr:GNAT family N-acetyltransferase [Phenylobacterium sp.]MDP1874852.1 GNAT family N-acetyltransferase [Phenylobacterium sp.]